MKYVIGENDVDFVENMALFLKINSNTQSNIEIRQYDQDPKFERLPDEFIKLGRCTDIIIERKNTIEWPIEITFYFNDEDLENAGIIEEQIFGVSYYKDDNWVMYDDPIINLDDVIIHGKPYAGSITVQIWSNQLSPKIMVGKTTQINEPKQGYLYFNNMKLLPTFSGNTIVLGNIPVVIDTYSIHEVENVEFYLNDKLMYIDDDYPYEWIWTDFGFRPYNLKVIANDEVGNKLIDEMRIWKIF